MKRFLILIMFVCFFTGMMSVSIYADEAAPTVKSYKAIVINPNGAEVEHYDSERLEYGTEIVITHEYESGGVLEGFFRIDGGDGSGYIKLSDIKAFNEKEKIDIDYGKSFKLKVLDEDGVKLYAGPAQAYSEVDTIPYGTEMIGHKELFEYKKDGDYPWYYIEYNGKKGWICELGKVGVVKEKIEFYLTNKETTMYTQVNQKVISTIIPANSEIKGSISVFLGGEGYSYLNYVEYNGIWGFVSDSDIAFKDSRKWKVPADGKKLFKTTLYEDRDSNVLVDNIPIGTELDIDYIQMLKYGGWIHTSYKGQKGWVMLEDGELSEERNEEIADENEIEVLNKNIKKDELNDFIDSKNDKGELVQSVKKEEENFRLTGMQIVVICIGVAVIIALTAIVTIVLVNKKNKVEKTGDSEESEKKN